ncbi:FdhF/YdeP family oxidoreductase [Tenacibaculum maritimum]|uniref:FdhF/YdeP family oxidoreductase n=1 Tax=Tenacibaculum maritimum TaxID=107401 RepID=UPI001E40986A|nr:FdhF/YdeP family oxidoreductase [Tenacibaculum maritimum]MCD9561675.1 FdhF/YdeP family oxidoreductase [Tenacibaculum maritimum]MCD9564682.1 FdhF/YdeP family oxidoreductase [Tenacibaculum maritimum]MCD9577811.1 FdhF/YdeP family oxidoreductase [Tenacibaculum maritimum]MCD9597333.1 FdhF/YdeP family oxidoreductase [Tenacibaculum maritimum]MCD9612333.1 FdhF/YdeP family oxidoreductase [Tenacibaculum maritimum]
MSDKKIQAQPPAKLTGIELIDIPRSAVGVKAIKSALTHVTNEIGITKGIGLLAKINQKEGFDCPGCAWPDPDEKRAFLAEYCENGAKAIAEEATKNRVSPLFFATHSIEELSQLSDYEIGKSGRITHPMILKEGANYYEEISWDAAFNLIGKELNTLPSPDEAIFYTSGRTSNEAAFLYQLFVRQFGTNNLPDCSNMCHESSGTALSETLGIGKGSVTLEDFNHADLVIVIGQNPGTNHPRMLTALGETKKNGGQIITINPLPEVGLMNYNDPQNPIKWFGAGQKLTDLFLQVKINGDVALLKIILKMMKQKELETPNSVFNHQFINEKTHGLEDFLQDLDTYSIDELLPQTGLALSEIEAATQLIINNDKIIICWAMGLTQHKNAVDNIREVVNLLLLKGSIGKKGAGTCPVRGHSNVQGDRTMGIWEKPKEAFLHKLEEEFHFEAPRKHGYDVVGAIEAMHKKEAKVFIGMGGNFISATPDTEFTAKALQNCSLTVQISTKLNRSHLIHGKQALILPCLGRSEKDFQESGEQFVTVENSMGVVHQSHGHLTPLSEHLLSEPAIVAGMASATLKNTKVNWNKFITNYDFIRDKIEATIPGFNNYNERSRIKGGFYLPNNARENNFEPTKTGKANFTINKPSEVTLNKNQFLMMTIRTHDQYNTTIYGLNDRYRGVLNERRVIFMNLHDMKKLGLKKLDSVNLVSHFQGEQRKAPNFLVIPYDIPEQCTATYFPEANVLVPIKSKADISHTPASKTVIISIHKL